MLKTSEIGDRMTLSLSDDISAGRGSRPLGAWALTLWPRSLSVYPLCFLCS